MSQKNLAINRVFLTVNNTDNLVNFTINRSYLTRPEPYTNFCARGCCYGPAFRKTPGYSSGRVDIT